MTKYLVNRHQNDAPVPEGMARNPRFMHGVKVQPYPPTCKVWSIQEFIRVTGTYGFTDCPFDDSYLVLWTGSEVADADLAAISEVLGGDRS